MASQPHNLVVVESPAKATTIRRFLGDDYRVEASYGHIRDLPQNADEIPAAVRKQPWARLGVNVEEGFAPVYVVPAEKKKHVKRLQEAIKHAARLLLATDEDREGESISWHVLELLRPDDKIEVQRIVFHEVTPEAIRDALASPRRVNQDLVRAQEARRVLDRLYGYSLSPLLWKRVAPGLSAGRVQSVAVRLLVERERERMAFRTSSYWDLKASLTTGRGSFEARLTQVDGRRLADGRSFDPETGRLRDREKLLLDKTRATSLAAAARTARPWRVASLDTKPGVEKPAPPFITSTLQQEANRKLRFTSKRTMSVAQQLYDGIDLDGERVGLITYMRTDSVTLAERALQQARKVISNAYGDDYLPPRPVRYRTKSKGAQEAHEAIRPTDLSRRPQDVRKYLNGDQHRLYELIWKRTLACQMVPARIERTTVEVEVETPAEGVAGGGERLTFYASGKRIVFPGFLRAYVEGSDDPEAELGDKETLLPELTEGRTVEPESVAAEGHETKPPYRYTEASLVKKLEEEGIGRPRTYATILGTIQERGYVFKKGNELIPTFTAFCVTQLLEKQFRDLVDTHFTAHMEDDLDEIAAGQKAWDDLVTRFFLGGDGDPGLQKRVEEGEIFYPEIPLGADPETGEPLVVKVGRYGPYLRRGEGGSENSVSLPREMPPADLTPEMVVRMFKDKAEASDSEPLTRDPSSGRAIFLRHGRFGPYLELETSDDERSEKKKPHRVSVPDGLDAGDLTEELAQRLIALPRELGEHPETGEPVVAGLGRYGPYVKLGRDYRNLGSWRQALEIDLDAALKILAQPKPGRGSRQKVVLKELGEHETAAGPVRVLDGRYGPYVTDGETNATLPKGADPREMTLERAVEMLEVKRKMPKKGRARSSAKSKKPVSTKTRSKKDSG